MNKNLEFNFDSYDFSRAPMTADEVNAFDVVIVAFSGGKDSTASYLHLEDLGVDKSKVILLHNDIDGREGSSLMDHNVTPDYVLKFAEAFNVPLRNVWREGGLEGELLKEDAKSKGIYFERVDTGEKVYLASDNASMSTRRKWPGMGRTTRWCTPIGKTDPSRRWLTNDEFFNNAKVLYISGERADEGNRASLAEYEKHHSYTERSKLYGGFRHIYHWRPVHKWNADKVWDKIGEYKVRAHPCYYVGYGRASCAGCIYGNEDAFATLRLVSPDKFNAMVVMEEKLDHTVKPDGRSLVEWADAGTPYKGSDNLIARELLNSKTYNAPIFVEGVWERPTGSGGDVSCGSV